MSSSYTQAALVAQNAAAAPVQAAAAPVAEKIPSSMAKFMDVESDIPITSIQLDALVVAKILKHSRDASGSANGLLLGLDLDGTLEVSNSFALPNNTSSDSEDKSSAKATGARYEASMLRVLKEANYDDGLVGFYQATTMGAFLRQSFISSQILHQDALRQGGIALVHDVSQAARGAVSLKAYRLSGSFLAANKMNKFDSQSLLEHGITFSTILEELPVVIRTNPLTSALLSNLSSRSSSSPLAQPTYSALITPSASTSTSGASKIPLLESLTDTLESYRQEENTISFQIRQIARERARMDAHVAKRKEENAQRVEKGLAPLPEEDLNRLFHISADGPGRLDTTLLLGQADALAKALETSSVKDLVALYTAQA